LQKDDPSAALFLNDLLVSQDRLALAEQNLLDSQAELAIAYVRLKRTTGELLRDNAGAIGSGGCSTCQCGDSQCDCANVSQATWHQPAQQETIIENGHQFINEAPGNFQSTPLQQPIDQPLDIPRHPESQPGVTPMPLDSNTAGEIFSAPTRYPLSTQHPAEWQSPRY